MKKTFTLLLLLLLLIVFLIAFGMYVQAGETPIEKLAVDIGPILENGCIRIPATKEGQGQCCIEVPAHLDCTQLGFEKQYGCSPVLEVPNYLGGLEPKVPIVECIFHGKWGEETKDGIRSRAPE